MLNGQCDDKGCSLIRCTPCGDFPSVTFDDLPTDCQAHARPLIFPALMQPLKGLENPLEVFFIETDAIVFHPDLTELQVEPVLLHPVLFILQESPPDLYNGGLPVSVEFERIPDEVLQQLTHLHQYFGHFLSERG